jgi:hypothetical protein
MIGRIRRPEKTGSREGWKTGSRKKAGTGWSRRPKEKEEEGTPLPEESP